MPGQYDSDRDGTQDMVPAAPATAPTASAGAVDVTVTWMASVDTSITAYRIYRNAMAGSTAIAGEHIAEVAADAALSYTDSSPLAGENYYAISAVNAAGEGALSPLSNVAEIVPIELESSAGTSFSINESDDTPSNIAIISITESGATPATIDPYRILDGHSGFAIADDGQLTAMIDYEALNSSQQTNGLSLMIQGAASDGRMSVITLTITIANIDDETPEFVSFPTTASIASGTTVFQGGDLVINATDDLGTEIEYAFLNFDGTTTNTTQDFAIAANTGIITVASAPVYDMDDPAANSRMLTIQARDSSAGAIGMLTVDDDIVIEVLLIVDSDHDGLIDINNLEDLDNIRHNLSGTSYKTSESDSGSTMGCPPLPAGCNGYELTRSLDFADGASYASGEVNDDWRPAGGDPDAATNGGWMPIATNPTTLDAVFEGNGNTIANLYSRGDGERGLFGSIGRDATIRNVGIIDGTIYGGGGSDTIGLLVGINESGTITASYAAGVADGGFGGADRVGVLVGRNNSGTIIASYATGSVNRSVTVGGLVGDNNGSIIASYATGNITGDGNDSNVGGLVGNNSGSIIASYATGNITGDGITSNVGGLVGRNSGSIIASYATGEANGADFNSDVGGLVGVNEFNGSIIASYAVGNVDGGGGGNSNVGGLIGSNGGSIIASYAVGNVDGGGGDNSDVGGLIGSNGINSRASASYGFGDVIREATVGINRADDADASIHSPAFLTATNSSTTPANRWNTTVWDFGNDRLYPVVKWVTGYDATAGTFSCDLERLPDGQICGAPLPSQYDGDGDGAQDTVPEAPAMPMATATASAITITWTSVGGPEITAYRIYRNETVGNSALGNRPIAEVAADDPLTYTDNDPQKRREPLRRLRGERRGRGRTVAVGHRNDYAIKERGEVSPLAPAIRLSAPQTLASASRRLRAPLALRPPRR